MTEEDLLRRGAYRRTWAMIDRWTPPEGVRVDVVCHHDSRQIDVVMIAGGLFEADLNVRFRSQGQADAVLDHLAGSLMARCVAAYEAHEVDGGEDVVLKMTLAQASRTFHEGLESARCRGKGGED